MRNSKLFSGHLGGGKIYKISKKTLFGGDSKSEGNVKLEITGKDKFRFQCKAGLCVDGDISISSIILKQY